MRILIITKTFPESPSDWKGIFVREQADALSTQHKVSVIKCTADNSVFKPFFSTTVNHFPGYPYDYKKVSVARSFPLYNQINYLITLYKSVKSQIKSSPPDLIHCHQSYPCGIIALMIRRNLGIPYIITEHTGTERTFRSVFHKFLSLHSLKRADKVIAVSPFLKEEMALRGVRNSVVIHNTLDTGRFFYIKKNRKPFILGFLASLNDEDKGLGLLLSAASELPFDYRLKIGGPGSLEKVLKESAVASQLTGKIIRIENVNVQNINDFFSDINLLVHPSYYETFGMVLIEAMACGIPVVATDCGGPASIITDETGLLVQKGNPQEIRDAIIKVFNDYERYDPVKIKDYINSTFSYDKFLEKINEVYSVCS